MFHLKAFGMIRLHYETRICQSIYNRVTMTVCVKCVVQFYVHKTLIWVNVLKASFSDRQKKFDQMENDLPKER